MPYPLVFCYPIHQADFYPILLQGACSLCKKYLLVSVIPQKHHYSLFIGQKKAPTEGASLFRWTLKFLTWGTSFHHSFRWGLLFLTWGYTLPPHRILIIGHKCAHVNSFMNRIIRSATDQSSFAFCAINQEFWHKFSRMINQQIVCVIN